LRLGFSPRQGSPECFVILDHMPFCSIDSTVAETFFSFSPGSATHEFTMIFLLSPAAGDITSVGGGLSPSCPPPAANSAGPAQGFSPPLKRLFSKLGFEPAFEDTVEVLCEREGVIFYEPWCFLFPPSLRSPPSLNLKYLILAFFCREMAMILLSTSQIGPGGYER